MRYKQGQKEQTREWILAAAGRSFRKGGYTGVGVDGLAKEAGVPPVHFMDTSAQKQKRSSPRL